MIIITFTFLGDKVKIFSEGSHCMNKEDNDKPQLKKIQEMNNSLLNKDGHKYKDAWGWCKNNSVKKWKKGRHTNFIF